MSDLLWKGRRADRMGRVELVEALETADRIVRKTRKDATHEREVWRSIKRPTTWLPPWAIFCLGGIFGMLATLFILGLKR